MIANVTAGKIEQNNLWKFCPICGASFELEISSFDKSNKNCVSCEKSIIKIWNVNADQAKMSRLCTNCKNITSAKALFCILCGEKISSLSIVHDSPNDRQYNVVQKYDRRSIGWSIASLGCFSIGLLLLLFAYLFTSTFLIFLYAPPYNILFIMIFVLGIVFGKLSFEVPTGKIGVILNSLAILGCLIYTTYFLVTLFSQSV